MCIHIFFLTTLWQMDYCEVIFRRLASRSLPVRPCPPPPPGMGIWMVGCHLFWHRSLTQWMQSPISVWVLFWQSAILGCMESIICFTDDNSRVMVDSRCLRTSLFKAEKQTTLINVHVFQGPLMIYVCLGEKIALALGELTRSLVLFAPEL